MPSMTFIDFTSEASKKIEGKELCKIDQFTDEQLELFTEFVSVHPYISDIFSKTESSEYFFKRFPEFKELGIASSELFYSFKLGYNIEGIPSRLVFVINKAIEEYGMSHPNSTLWTCYKLITKYAKYYFKTEDGDLNLQDVLYGLFKTKFDLITPRRNVSGSEVYVHNKDTIALLPEDILTAIDGKKVYYDKEGLYVGEEKTLLRIMNSRLGITLDDFDLRESV